MNTRELPGLACGRCGTTAGVEVVCHHCGRPLCRRHRIQAMDRTLKNENGKNADGKKVSAYHCRECRRKYHGLLSFLYQWWGS
ncbi:MAG: hypothetical protein AB1791_15480, partial [Chloroflexota bacterium]